MESKHAIVINKHGYKVEFVLVNFVEENSEIKERPMYYTLKLGESLIYDDIDIANSMIKPQWDGSAWEETAMPEEIGSAQPEPAESQPSEMNIVMLAVAELYEMITGGGAA